MCQCCNGWGIHFDDGIEASSTGNSNSNDDDDDDDGDDGDDGRHWNLNIYNYFIDSANGLHCPSETT